MISTRQIASLGLAIAVCSIAAPSVSRSVCEPSGTVTMALDRSLNVEIIGSSVPLRITPNQDAYDGYLEIVGDLAPGERKPFFPIKAIAEVRAGDLYVTWWGGSVEEGSKVETIISSDWRYAALLKIMRPLGRQGRSYIPHCR